MPLLTKYLKSAACRPIEFHYWLYSPYTENQPPKLWPLLIFLHGAGERGTDLNLVKQHGPLKQIDQGKAFPFFIAAPQCPAGEWWFASKLDLWLNEIIQSLPVDSTRIYLTGLSMGGFATWYWAIERPERFAAIAPVCGGGEPFLAERLKNIPVWAFHGAKDEVVPLRRSTEMVDALKKIGGNVRLTIYENADHDSWTETYANPELYTWFLNQKKQTL